MVPNGYQADTGQQTQPSQGKPGWLAPALVILVVAVLYFGSRKREEVAENPLVDLLILTVGVLAFAHVIKFAGMKLGSPGLARFASLNYTSKDNGTNG